MRGFIPWFGLPPRRPYIHVVEALTKSIASRQSSLFREHNHGHLDPVGNSDTSAAELATTGLTDDLVLVQPVPLDLHVAGALADVIAPTPCSDTPPVQPVLKAWLPRA